MLDWAAAMAAMGVLKDPEARADIQKLLNEFPEPWEATEGPKGHTGKDRLKIAVEKARKSAGSGVAAARGNLFHQLAENRAKGRPVGFVDQDMIGFLAAFDEAMKKVEVVDSEMFLVEDRLQVAGSADLLVRIPDGRVVIGDIKTGKWDAKYPLHVTVQEACYSHGQRYNQASNTRTPIHPDLDPDTGLMLHFPIAVKGAVPKFYLLDLKAGYEAAILAPRVKELRKMKELEEVKL